MKHQVKELPESSWCHPLLPTPPSILHLLLLLPKINHHCLCLAPRPSPPSPPNPMLPQLEAMLRDAEHTDHALKRLSLYLLSMNKNANLILDEYEIGYDPNNDPSHFSGDE